VEEVGSDEAEGVVEEGDVTLEEVFEGEQQVLEEIGITVDQLDKSKGKSTEFSDMLFGRKGSNRKENEEELKEEEIGGVGHVE